MIQVYDTHITVWHKITDEDLFFLIFLDMKIGLSGCETIGCVQKVVTIREGTN